MLKYGTMCSYGTTEIAAVIKQAVSAPNISSIILDMDSGGGAVDAIAPLVDAIAEAKAAGKPNKNYGRWRESWYRLCSK